MANIGRPRKKVGQPTKLSPAVQEKICDAIRAGNYIETSASYAGVDKQTLYNWLKWGARDGKGAFWEFSKAVERAMADAEVRDVALIGRAASTGVWQASAWRLERRYPLRWGRRDQCQVDTHVATTKTDPDDAAEKLLQLIVQGNPGGDDPSAAR